MENLSRQGSNCTQLARGERHLGERHQDPGMFISMADTDSIATFPDRAIAVFPQQTTKSNTRTAEESTHLDQATPSTRVMTGEAFVPDPAPTALFQLPASNFVSSTPSRGPRASRLLDSPAENTGHQGHWFRVGSPELWRWEGTRTWVAFETELPIPSELQERWTKIKNDLIINLKDVQTEMIAEQSFQTSHRKQRHPRRNIVVELRMSGHQERFAKWVHISPCIWVLCGSHSCKRKASVALQSLSLPVNFTNQPIEVHANAPEFNATASFIPLSQLQHDIDKDLGIRHLGGIILHHVEVDQATDQPKSACGLLCCSTFLKDRRVIDQRISRIGGLLADGFGSLNNTDLPIAMTTSHGIFDYLWRDKATASSSTDVRSSKFDSNLVNNDDEFIVISDSESDSASSSLATDVSDVDSETSGRGAGKRHVNTANRVKTNRKRLLGERDPSEVSEWRTLEEIVGIKFIRQQVPCQVLANPEPSDYALLRSKNLAGFRNILSRSPSDEITSIMSEDELQEGTLFAAFTTDNLTEVKLLPGMSTMPTGRGDDIQVRKIQTLAPLAPGTSGTWLVRGSALAGMIVAFYPKQPLALFITAQNLVHDIKASFPFLLEPLPENLMNSPVHSRIRQELNQNPPWDTSSHQGSLDSTLLFGTTESNQESDMTSMSSVTINSKPADRREKQVVQPSKKEKDEPAVHDSKGVREISTGHSHTSRRTARTVVKTQVWYCHNCSCGPFNVKIDRYCPYCYHERCSGCAASTIRTPAGR